MSQRQVTITHILDVDSAASLEAVNIITDAMTRAALSIDVVVTALVDEVTLEVYAPVLNLEG